MQYGIRNCTINGEKVSGAGRINLDPVTVSRSYTPAGSLRERKYRYAVTGYTGTLEVYTLPECLRSGEIVNGATVTYLTSGGKELHTLNGCTLLPPAVNAESMSGGGTAINPYSIPIEADELIRSGGS